MNNEQPIDIVSLLEQAETELDNKAKLFAGYYKSLLAEGIPEHLARSLVVALQDRLIPQVEMPK